MSTIIGFGDGTVEADPWNNRFGAVYFYNNVVVAIANRNNYGLKASSIFQNGNLQNGPTTLYALNNLFYTLPASPGNARPTFAACYWQRYVDFTQDWSSMRMLKKFASATDGNSAVGVPCDGSGMSGIAVSHANPGFVNAAGGDFHLQPTSPYFKLKAPLPNDVTLRKLQPDGIAYPTPNP
jgi:hypothetical protein